MKAQFLSFQVPQFSKLNSASKSFCPFITETLCQNEGSFFAPIYIRYSQTLTTPLSSFSSGFLFSFPENPEKNTILRTCRVVSGQSDASLQSCRSEEHT